jgi:hypothetical protein
MLCQELERLGETRLFLHNSLLDFHSASWADYKGYIGLTPLVPRQDGTIPIDK